MFIPCPLWKKAELCLPSPSHFSLPLMKAPGVAGTRGPSAQALRASHLTGHRVNRRVTEGDKSHRPRGQHDSPSQAWRWDSGSSGDRVLLSAEALRKLLVQSSANSSQQRERATYSKGNFEAQRAKGQPKITQPG